MHVRPSLKCFCVCVHVCKTGLVAKNKTERERELKKKASTVEFAVVVKQIKENL